MTPRNAALLVCCLLLACSPRAKGNGSAGVPGDVSIHVTTTVMDDDTFRSGNGSSVIDLTTASARGDFTASFNNPDPAMVLTIKVASVSVHEGDRVDFPLVSGIRDADLNVKVVHRGITYSTDRPDPSGTMDIEQLKVVDGSVDFRTTFTLTLSSDGTQKLTMQGYYEGHQGSASFTDTTP